MHFLGLQNFWTCLFFPQFVMCIPLLVHFLRTMANYHDSLMPCGPDFNGPLILWNKTRWVSKEHSLFSKTHKVFSQLLGCTPTLFWGILREPYVLTKITCSCGDQRGVIMPLLAEKKRLYSTILYFLNGNGRDQVKMIKSLMSENFITYMCSNLQS